MAQPNKSEKTLLFASTLLIATFLVEFAGGLVFKSLSLFSDSFHVLSDLTSILVTFASLKIALRKKPTQQMAFGYHRLEVISALFNGILLSMISAFILIEAWDRIKHPESIDTTGALIVSSIGLFVNLLIAYRFKRTEHAHGDVNIESAYFHVLGDTLASVSVVVGILGIKMFQLPMIDPLVASIVAVLILFSSVRVLLKSSEILLHKSPQDIDNITERVKQIPGVRDFKDVRLWQVCSHLTVGTAHAVVDVDKIDETEIIKQKIRTIIEEEFGIRDITLECETALTSSRHLHSFQDKHS